MNYLEYYQLEKEPFSIMPLTQFYYHNAQHDRALERIYYGVAGMKGLTVLIGEIGLGKSLLARRLLELLPEEEYEVSLLVVLHEDVDSVWLLKRIAAQVGIVDCPEDKVEIMTRLLHRLQELAAEGKKTIVLIDEAHMLRKKSLMEEIRGLLNLELEDHKLISLVLFGLPELELCLQTDQALAQRVAVRSILNPVPQDTVAEYVRFRLAQAGGEKTIFSEAFIEKLHHYSRGIPRLINVLCDNALFEGFVRKAPLPLKPDILESVAEDLGITALL